MPGRLNKRTGRATVQLRTAIDLMPRDTREAMLRGIDRNRIVAGAYADGDSGGVCPMLAAHRNGGRTDFAGFARAWDRFTNVRGPRRATRREVKTLRHYLELSLLRGEQDSRSLTELANEIRAERSRARATYTDRARVASGERNRSPELRSRRGWAWLRPTRRLDHFHELLAAAEEQVSEQRAAEVLGERERVAN